MTSVVVFPFNIDFCHHIKKAAPREVLNYNATTSNYLVPVVPVVPVVLLLEAIATAATATAAPTATPVVVAVPTAAPVAPAVPAVVPVVLAVVVEAVSANAIEDAPKAINVAKAKFFIKKSLLFKTKHRCLVH